MAKLRNPQDSVPLGDQPRESPRDTFRRQLQEARKRAGLTQSALAARVAELGGSLRPEGITRIEKGSREVSLEESLLLAAALGVAPVHLITPVTDDIAVQLAPIDRMIHAPHAVRAWIRGDWPLRLNRPEHVGTLQRPPDPDAHAVFEEWQPSEYRALRSNIAYRTAAVMLETLAAAVQEGLGTLPADEEQQEQTLDRVERRLHAAADEITDFINERRTAARGDRR